MPEVGAELMRGRSINDGVDPHAARRRALPGRGDDVADPRRRGRDRRLLADRARRHRAPRDAERAVRRLAAIVESSLGRDLHLPARRRGALVEQGRGAARSATRRRRWRGARSSILSHAGPRGPRRCTTFFDALERGETVEREALAVRKDGEPDQPRLHGVPDPRRPRRDPGRRHDRARRDRAAAARGAAAPGAEDGGRRPARGRHRARLQQPADGHHGLRPARPGARRRGAGRRRAGGDRARGGRGRPSSRASCWPSRGASGWTRSCSTSARSRAGWRRCCGG